MRKFALKVIDFFYPPFRRWFSLHTFRYLASGGITVSTGIVGYFIIFNYILHQQDVKIGDYLITAHIAALFIESGFTFAVGFMLNKYLVFTQSTLVGRIQLFRYATVYGTNILLNYALMKILVEGFQFFPSVAKALITIVLAISSYFSQKYFSFKVKKPKTP
ncbi:GtrA family protein [Pedobacter insulae]|uniref:GtrA-like protein n=1 Tax=Pedobacter insulae TaxID=414048 RepID=A0A1I2VPY5_9SPHI|nr:GtrA family protein [Pedobacter insulae]SFG91298.1 GtrA-like protein [Pedobacter insulae]